MKSARARSENHVKSSIGSYRVEQRQIIHNDRVFHFVSYQQPSGAASWFLMSEGTRWEVMPQVAGEDPAEVDRRLLAWLRETITAPNPR